MDQRPDVTVKLILRVGNAVFMLHHHANGAYDFPGGRMEWGESPEEALARELKEELSYTLPVEPTFFAIWNYIALDKSRHSLQVQYKAALPKRPDFTIKEAADGQWLDRIACLKQFQDSALVERLFL